jgi:hypothetical protein
MNVNLHKFDLTLVETLTFILFILVGLLVLAHWRLGRAGLVPARRLKAGRCVAAVIDEAYLAARAGGTNPPTTVWTILRHGFFTE